MIIKMTESKELVTTIKTTIFRGETRADLITFLIPMEYEGINMADCAWVMRYILPSGEGKSEPLAYLPEPYKSYLQLSTVVNTRLTAKDGEVTVWLTAYGNNDGMVLKTGETVVEIEPSKNVADYMSDADIDELDALSVKVAELETVTTALEAGSPDNISYDAESKTLRLTNSGEPIGDPVDMSVVVPDNEDDPSTGGPGSDGVIHF